MSKVRVLLDERSYSIHIGGGLLARLGAECAGLKLGHRCALITDANVAPLHAPAAEKSLRDAGFEPVTIILPPGESTKNWAQVGRCLDQLAAARLERKSFVIALGGGVVGDLAGFVAAAYLRGVPFVQVPTSLLAQVDSSVGGKVGVNLRAGKNLAGAFHQPRLVLCDLNTLRTLPQREFRAGLAEVIKYGIITDAKLFAWLEARMDSLLLLKSASLQAVVTRSCEIKADVVAQDETEGGLRQILNFGHTIGHAIEAVSGYGRHLHGEAISIGQVAAARISERLAGLPADASLRIENAFASAGLPTHIRLSAAKRKALFAAMRLDKKVSGGAVKFVLARHIGKVEWGREVPDALIHEVLDGMEK